ncbi:MAG: peptide-methionine (S)-S-oxide reductase MsrA [Phycisphaerales bacterium]|nr:peptide-methionine (S)-S-oxide reductase MsrA [Phycisphaerales bacterium]
MRPIMINTLLAMSFVAGCADSAARESTDQSKTSTKPGATDRTEAKPMNLQTAMFGAGCFWGVEETFRQTKGVVKTEVGYAGGNVDNPTYKQVCTDRTGHAEVVRIEFNPALVSYEQLLDIFWANHNPTTLNRQGPDVGSQYRSAVFYFTPEQKATAEASKERLEKSGKWKKPIVTEITEAKPFWRAEDYHQQYLAKRGLSNCHVPEQP